MSLTKVSYSMINGAPINVLDYGADPTGVADSTAAFNSALAAGKELFVPAGTYKVTSITHPNYQTIIRGEGSGSTIINSSGTYGLIYGTNTGSRFSQLRDLTIYAAAGTTALRIQNLGVHIYNCVFRGGNIGILLQNSVAHYWENVVAYGSYAGLHVLPGTAQDVVWLCNFVNVQTSGNQLSDYAYGMRVDNTVFSITAYMKDCVFTQLDAELVGVGISIVNDSCLDNTFIGTWVESARDYYIGESNLSRNTWINTQVSPGSLAPTYGAVYSNQSLLINGTTIQPVANGGTTIGVSQQNSTNVFQPIGPKVLAKESVASSTGLYVSNQATKPTGYFSDFYVVEKAFKFGATTTSTAIIQIQFNDNPAGTVEVELGEFRSTAASSAGVLKYRRSVLYNGTTGINFATIDTDYKNSVSDITFTSVSATKFNLVYTYTGSQPDRIGVIVRVSCLAAQGDGTGVNVTALI
jgi:hypothetical protein